MGIDQRASLLIRAVRDALDGCPDRRTLAVLESPPRLGALARDHVAVRDLYGGGVAGDPIRRAAARELGSCIEG